MTIEKTNDGFEVECDGENCTETLSINSPGHDWSDFMAAKRENGWASLKEVDDQWVHLCPHCKDDYS